MSTKLRIAYVSPAHGGVADYARLMEVIYQQQGYTIVAQTIDTSTDLQTVVKKVVTGSFDLCHFEIGAADSMQLEISRQLRKRRAELPQLITIHDPGVVVRHPLAVPAADSSNRLVRLGGKVVRKILSRSIGQLILRRHLADPGITTIYLRADCATRPNAYYLPQPTYHQDCPAAPKRTPLVVGFGGFWGPAKGIETLLQAWRIAGNDVGLRLIVGGGSGIPNDPYAATIRKQAMAMQPPAELPGFASEGQLDDFLRALGVLVLPYWPELPNGTSAMAMRAAELALPIIASDVPALRSFLGANGAYYVPPKDPEHLAVAMREFATNPKAFAHRAATLQRHIYAEHGWKTVGRRLKEIITEVMEAKE